MRRVFSKRSRLGDHGNHLAADDAAVVSGLALISEGDLADNKGVDGVVLAHADILAWHDLGTALADDDLAWARSSAVPKLDAKVFRV